MKLFKLRLTLKNKSQAKNIHCSCSGSVSPTFLGLTTSKAKLDILQFYPPVYNICGLVLPSQPCHLHLQLQHLTDALIQSSLQE